MTGLEVNGRFVPLHEIQAQTEVLREEARRTGAGLTYRALAERAETMLINQALLEAEAEARQPAPSEDAVEQALNATLPRSDGVMGCRAGVDLAASRAATAVRIRVDALLRDWWLNLIPPTTAQMRSLYKHHREEFYAAESVVAEQIVCNVDSPGDRTSADARIQEAERQLNDGLPFPEAARLYSDCPANGGSLGRIFRGHMVPEFESVVFAAAPGKPTPIFETRFGFHIALVSDRRPEGILPFEAVLPELERAYIAEGKQLIVTAKLASLRQKATIRRVES